MKEKSNPYVEKCTNAADNLERAFRYRGNKNMLVDDELIIYLIKELENTITEGRKKGLIDVSFARSCISLAMNGLDDAYKEKLGNSIDELYKKRLSKINAKIKDADNLWIELNNEKERLLEERTSFTCGLYSLPKE